MPICAASTEFVISFCLRATAPGWRRVADIDILCAERAVETPMSRSFGPSLAEQSVLQGDVMKISIKAELVYSFAAATQIIANLEASHSGDQMILSESLDIQPPAKFLSDESSYGD